MKYFPFILLFISCQSNQFSERDAITPEETEIAQDLIQGAFDDLWGGVDSTKIQDYHTEDFIILEQGEIWDNKRIIEYMKGQLGQKDRPRRINKMDYISIEKYGTSMQIAYFNTADFMRLDSLVGQGKWLESALAVSTPEGWRLKMMHSTRVRN